MGLENKKKIIIIGAGISGMSAGIYALDNGYDVQIYEKHSIVGGQCTGWNRNGVYIDGCAHWIVGTNPNSLLFPLWKHVGAFDENSIIYDTEFFSKYDIDGTIITFYASLEKLKEELLRVAPEDKKQIKRIINGIKAYQHVQIPVKKPLDKMNLFELTKFGINMLPMVFHYIYYKHISVEEYIKKFKSETLRKLFLRIINKNYNIHTLFYIMQTLSRNDAGVVEGGSRQFAFNIKNNYLKNGGKLFLNKTVKEIIIEKNVAKGIVLEDGSKVFADYVIASGDMYHILNDLLKNNYFDRDFNQKITKRNYNPLITCMLFSYKVNIRMNNYPKMINFAINNIEIADTIINNITIRNHAFDDSINKNENTTLTVLVDVNDTTYDYFKNMDASTYLSVKNRIGDLIKEEIINYLKIDNNSISLIDVATPLTYNRYTNAYKGSYMSFLTTKRTKGLMRKGLIKGLKNFVIAGQWIMPPGGLPIALFSGKHAIYRICRMDKKIFIDLDEDNLIKNTIKVKSLT